jgi:predicted ATPase
MITELRIERFKRYRDQRFSLRPLTVLTGINGAGKSTVLQSLLLIRQAWILQSAAPRSSVPQPPLSDFQHSRVELNGPFGLSLGEALDVLHFESDPREGIAFSVTDSEKKTYRMTLGIPDERSRRLEITNRWLENNKPGATPSALSGRQRDFLYLCADRLGPQDVFDAVSLDEDDLNVGARGESVAQVLAQLDLSAVRELVVHPSTEQLNARKTLPAQAELWLSSIVTPIQLEAKWIPGTSVTTLRFRQPGFQSEWLRPSNAGFGLSYALPIVVGGLAVQKSGLFLVENPEAHLHPMGQSAMGEFLARVAGSGAQVIVETHSDHVLNGVRRAVASQPVLSPSDVIIHFFDNSRALGTAPSVTSLEVRANGELSAWPPGFFDQIERDLGDLARARRRRS